MTDALIDGIVLSKQTHYHKQ